jgi:hypothetical protein
MTPAEFAAMMQHLKLKAPPDPGKVALVALAVNLLKVLNDEKLHRELTLVEEDLFWQFRDAVYRWSEDPETRVWVEKL